MHSDLATNERHCILVLINRVALKIILQKFYITNVAMSVRCECVYYPVTVKTTRNFIFSVEQSNMKQEKGQLIPGYDLYLSDIVFHSW